MNLEREIAPRLTSMSSSNFLSSDIPVIVFISDKTINLISISNTTEIDRILSFSHLNKTMKNMSEKEAEIWILRYLLTKTFGKDDFRISGKGKRIKGYGLIQEDFDLEENVKKVFSKIPSYRFKQRKKKLLEQHLIEEHKHKRYMITPLGIARLGQNPDNLDSYTINNIIRFCNFYETNKAEIIPMEKLQPFTKKVIRICMWDACVSIEIDDRYLNTLIDFKFRISNTLNAKLFEFVNRIDNSDFYDLVFSYSKPRLIRRKIKDKIYHVYTRYSKQAFYQFVANYLLEHFYFYMYKSQLGQKENQIVRLISKKRIKLLGKKNIRNAMLFLKKLVTALYIEHDNYNTMKNILKQQFKNNL